MNKQTRRKFSAEFKAKVALEAVKNQQTLAELSKKFDISPVVISKWKGEFLENISAAFEKESPNKKEEGPGIEQLYAQIGEL
uniref:transposase n=1 Tax=Cyclobacterium xiamenense TaxID=1297121 RepID=UPI0012B78128